MMQMVKHSLVKLKKYMHRYLAITQLATVETLLVKHCSRKALKEKSMCVHTERREGREEVGKERSHQHYICSEIWHKTKVNFILNCTINEIFYAPKETGKLFHLNYCYKNSSHSLSGVKYCLLISIFA